MIAALRLFSYKLTHDAGFAPTPFWGILTLATCKPGIRRAKRIGDWIAGFTSEKLCGDPVGGERLIYLMQVAHKPTMAEYFRDPTFRLKIPDPDSRYALHWAGDNIYRPLNARAEGSAEFEQLRNPNHWDGGGSCSRGESKKRDVSGKFVLVAERFAYFGRDAIPVPEHIRPEIPLGQSANGSLTRDQLVCQKFIDFVLARADSRRVLAPPHDWPPGDESWREGSTEGSGP